MVRFSIVGSGAGIAFRDLAQAVITAVGSGSWEYAPFSPERKALEPGNFYADIRKIRQTLAGSRRSRSTMGSRARWRSTASITSSTGNRRHHEANDGCW